MQNNYLTRKEVQDILRISNAKIFQLLHEGELPSFRVGNRYRICPTDLEDYIKKHSGKHA